jgi:hypothetical protein
VLCQALEQDLFFEAFVNESFGKLGELGEVLMASVDKLASGFNEKYSGQGSVGILEGDQQQVLDSLVILEKYFKCYRMLVKVAARISYELFLDGIMKDKALFDFVKAGLSFRLGTSVYGEQCVLNFSVNRFGDSNGQVI